MAQKRAQDEGAADTALGCALRDATRTIDSHDLPAHPAAARARDAAILRRS